MRNYEFPQWAVSVPDPATVCNFCKGVFEAQHLITCPDKINICLTCAGLITDIAQERKEEIREAAIEEMLRIESTMFDSYEPRDLMRRLYSLGYRKEAAK